MCKMNEQTKREKPDVERRPSRPVVPPGKTGKGILND